MSTEQTPGAPTEQEWVDEAAFLICGGSRDVWDSLDPDGDVRVMWRRAASRLAPLIDQEREAARAEAELRWMKVAVMRDGEAIHEAQERAYDEGVAAGREWGRRVNAPYPRNPYRARTAGDDR